MLTFYPSRIPDPGVKKAPDPGSRIRIRNNGKLVDFLLAESSGYFEMVWVFGHLWIELAQMLVRFYEEVKVFFQMKVFFLIVRKEAGLIILSSYFRLSLFLLCGVCNGWFT
jgi:hypothetical protein